VTNPHRNKNLKSKTAVKKRKEKRVKAKKSISDFEKLEDLTSEFEKYGNKISSLRSDIRRLNDLHDSLESRVIDFKEYFEKKIRVVSNSVGDLETKIDEVRVSNNRLARDFDKFFEGHLPTRKINMPPPMTSQITIYKAKESIDLRIAILPNIIDKIMKRAKSKIDREDKPDEEVVGLLTGRVHDKTVIIEEAIPGRAAHAGYAEVALDPADLAEIIDKMMREGKNRNIVGWYHSHLDLGVFLSDVDIRTQLTLQQFSYVIALVVDPIRNRHGFFYVDTRIKMSDGRPKIIEFIKENNQNEFNND
jgi:proteasome lid subunit RPN8/RPN11